LAQDIWPELPRETAFCHRAQEGREGIMVDVKTYARDGCRGGREQFKWDSLKDQEFKDRDQYLGVTMKVGLMAKFGRYYQHDWYAKKRDTAEHIDNERKEVQDYEEELMQEALGLKPKKLLLAKKQLSPEELKEFFKPEAEKTADKKGREQMGPQKGDTAPDANGVEVDASVLFSDARIKGLGFADHRNAKLEKYKSDVLGTESKLEGIKSESIKVEVKSELMTDTESLRLGSSNGASASSASGFKKEEPKAEVKPEVKPEVKNEPSEASAPKRQREDEDEDENEEGRKAKKAEKKAKKKKKSDKKLKKAVKKAAKKVKRAAKKEKKMFGSRKTGSNFSDSSSSSS